MTNTSRYYHERISPVSTQQNSVKLALDAAINSLSLNRDGTQVAVAGRNVFKIISIDDGLDEVLNLRVGKNSLNYSTADVAWNHIDDHILASGATNGAVILWDINKKSKSKLDNVYVAHKRAVNRVCFHGSEAHLLLTADQNGYMKLFDRRLEDPVTTFIEHEQCNVRDIQFSPFDSTSFCAATEHGTIRMWDIRRGDACLWCHIAQSGPIYTIDWHPEERNWIATAGRAQIIKVWDCSDVNNMTLKFSIQTISDVARIKWRPQRKFHIASCALQLDCNIMVWDVRRPFIPFAAFDEHTGVAKSIAWKHDPRLMLSGGQDNLLIEHNFDNAKRPADHAIPAGMYVSSTGHISFAIRDNSSSLPPNRSITNNRVPTFFKKAEEKGEVFLDYVTSSTYSTESQLEPVDIINMAWFVKTAKRYLLTGHSYHYLCDHNAKVSLSLHRTQVAQTWTMLKLLFPPPKVVPKSVVKVQHSTPQTVDKTDVDKGKNLGSHHHHLSEIENTTSGPSDHDSDSDAMLTHIASAVSDMNGHAFFSNDDIDITFDDIPDIDPTKMDLTLPLEGFHHRHEIHDRPHPPQDFQNGPDSPASANESDVSAPVQPPQTVGAHLLRAKPITEHTPAFACTDLIVDTLKQFAEEGDVQSTVSMLLVLGSLIQPYISEELQEFWCVSYIELLGRFELWNKANEIIKLSNISEVTCLNHESTTVYTKCNICGKPLTDWGWWCTRCKTHTNSCSICNHPVKGVYVWCQSCSHGGHVDHMKQWFSEHKLCPTGCGHMCEYT